MKTFVNTWRQFAHKCRPDDSDILQPRYVPEKKSRLYISIRVDKHLVPSDTLKKEKKAKPANNAEKDNSNGLDTKPQAKKLTKKSTDKLQKKELTNLEKESGRTVNAGVKFDGATYMPNHTADFRWAQCADMFDVEPRDLEEIVPQWEAIFEEIGGYWQLDGVGGGTANC
ncbi:hypothetical protein QBC33DRAFT_512803 [Phialemonium atrogriseum]|uniref:Uncharacterized protein n=1 Tax=Phialemonium atrogriseum TaxID=1093897 RepID=A0AAJ0C7L5_9PEZI|nr:uncharacterized protein QBC33DRAFT_512803 [Phialemonium atrogriseum]KAK1770149.1 hypothetical protein QBC33DRAFT_512803 [Phialemonium atrogriseum]